MKVIAARSALPSVVPSIRLDQQVQLHRAFKKCFGLLQSLVMSIAETTLYDYTPL